MVYHVEVAGVTQGGVGLSACAARVIDPTVTRVIASKRKFLGVQADRKAYLEGVLLGLEVCREIGIRRMKIITDSEDIGYQLRHMQRTTRKDFISLVMLVHQGLLELDDWEVEVVDVSKSENVRDIAAKAIREGFDGHGVAGGSEWVGGAS